MTAADIDGVVTVARLAFPDHFESRACFENRLDLYPAGSFALSDAHGAVHGYLFAYPWQGESAPALNTLIAALPADADRIYLHDLALHPRARGGGFTRPIVEQLATQARADGWPMIALVAVNNAADFWARLGFEAIDSPAIRVKLESYGPDARYMMRRLT